MLCFNKKCLEILSLTFLKLNKIMFFLFVQEVCIGVETWSFGFALQFWNFKLGLYTGTFQNCTWYVASNQRKRHRSKWDLDATRNLKLPELWYHWVPSYNLICLVSHSQSDEHLSIHFRLRSYYHEVLCKFRWR